MKLKNRIKKFYDNVNSKTVKPIEEIVIVLMHNILLKTKIEGGVITG